MAGTIAERYGYPVSEESVVKIGDSRFGRCPFVDGPCTKAGGVCSIRSQKTEEQVIVCPKRMYGNGHSFLKGIADRAFENYDIAYGEDNLPALYPGDRVLRECRASDKPVVGVFGQDWGSEVRLPPAVPGGSQYSVDFTLVLISPSEQIISFAPVEVQTIDTTGSYKSALNNLDSGTAAGKTTVGFNWENVNKRIIPQLITKGLMLQAERLCHSGIYFVTTTPVLKRIGDRLGSLDRLRRIPPQPGAINFLGYGYDVGEFATTPFPLVVRIEKTISTSDMSLAFITPENLPEGGAFETALRRKLS